MHRKKMSSRKSKKLFSRTANLIHEKNARATPMRGGFRI